MPKMLQCSKNRRLDDVQVDTVDDDSDCAVLCCAVQLCTTSQALRAL